MFKSILKAIQAEFSGQAAKGYVGEISRYHRIQASPGFRAAAEYCQERLKELDLEAEILSFPANEQAKYWATPMFQEWEATEATLYLTEPEEARRKLADFRDCKLSLIQRSAPVDAEAEVVLLEDGEEAKEYEGLNLRGKIVLTKGELQRVHDLAVEKHGAIGIIFDGMRELPLVRHPMDLADARQYTSFWWTGDERKCFGFVLSPKEGERLRRLIKERKRENKPAVKVRAKVESRFWDGKLEVVSALIPGEIDEEVLVMGHLCHPQPSANDNASGAATVVEIARTLQRLINREKLAKLKRGIRFLLVPEMTGTYAYLATREDRIPKMIAGVNLDMVGQDQERCGSSFLIERPPEATPSFVGDLMERLREEFTQEVTAWGGIARYALFRHAAIPFSGGSDHYILSDPSVGVPTPLLIQWPDRFYHTSFDTLDKVDPRMLSVIGSLAATYAYFIANAAEREAAWLGYEMIARFKRRLVQQIQKEITVVIGKEDQAKPTTVVNDLEKKVSYLTEREIESLRSLRRLAEVETDPWQGEISAFAERELQQAKQMLLEQTGVKTAEPSKEPDQWEKRAAQIVPKRCYRGPLHLRPYLRRLDEEEREKLYRLRKDRKEMAVTLPTLALYWADGKRTLLEIANLVELETGKRDVELLLKHFELLAKMELIELKANPKAPESALYQL